MLNKICHFLYMPFTGLGLYSGYRGDNWLQNRIKIFKEYVLPSIFNQSNQNFILLISWRSEEKKNPIVKEFAKYLNHYRDLNFIFSYAGILFWDDKYSDNDAEWNLQKSLEKTLPYLKDVIGNANWVLFTIWPSDDMYLYNMVEKIQEIPLEEKAIGFKRGYIIDMMTKEISEYNPITTPPFYTIFFPKETFLNPDEYMKYIGRCKSHEYVGDFLPYQLFEERGFIVGTHTENISTTYNIPYRGRKLTREEAGNVMRKAGILDAPCLIGKSWKRLYFKLPHWLRRKIRYYLGEKFWAKFL